MKRFLAEPVLGLNLACIFAALLLFLVYPIVNVFLFPDVGTFIAILKDARYLRSFRNSLLMLILSTVSATFLGFIFAYALAKTDIPGKRLFRSIATLPLFSPPFMVAFSYLMMFGKSGLVTSKLLGLNVSILGWRGLWLVQTVAYLPVAFMSIEGVLSSISPSIEYAGRNMGASGWKLFRTVTLPLATPGVAGAALLVAILVLADFGNPMIIAGDFSVLATEAWMRIEGWADAKGAAVLSIFLLVPSVFIFLVQRHIVNKKSFVTITGKVAHMDAQPTPRAARALFFAFCALVSAMILLVYIGIFLGAFVKGWGFDWTLTGEWIGSVLGRGLELRNSVVFSLVAGVVSTLISIIAAYLVSRKRFPGRGIVDFLCILPAALPGICLGIGYSISFTSRPLDLYGTGLIIILVMIFWNLSMGYQTGLNSLKQISASLGESAANMGATSMEIFWQIEAPLIKNSFVSSFTTSFIRCITTLSIIVFLSTSGNKVATFTIMNFISDGYYGKGAALTACLLVITFAILGLQRLILGKRMDVYNMGQ